MKKLIIVLFHILLLCSAFALEDEKDEAQIEVWTITEQTGLSIPAKLDTAIFTYENANPLNNYSINNAHSGVMGSPIQSNIYFDRTAKNSFLFSRPYDAYYESLGEQKFYKTSVPYSQLTYNFSGSKITSDDFLRGLISVNPTPKLNFTAMYNYTGAKGMYFHQATQHHKAGLTGNYKSKWYDFNAAVAYHFFENQENGGIKDTEYIIHADSFAVTDPAYIPTNLENPQSSYKNIYGFYHQKIHLAHAKHQIDSVTVEYRPIVSLFTTSKYERSQKRYKTSNASDTTFYKTFGYKPLINPGLTQDSARVTEIRNIAGLSINEGFTKWIPFSAIAYIEHASSEYRNELDTLHYLTTKENELLFGAEVSKRTGENLLFDAYTRTTLTGRKAGDSELGGKLSSSFQFLNQRIGANVSALIKTQSPDYFENEYYSNYFMWKNNFDKTARSKVNGNLFFDNKWVEFSAGLAVENISNYIYFGKDAKPAQYSGDIQVAAANASLNLNLWIFHWMNKAVYQTSSQTDILPLPEWSFYSNAFLTWKMFKKVLTTQVGADCYYSTAFYAPNYMPATGVFFLQDKEKIGNFPVVSVYANIHLKTIRFFVKYFHLNQEFGANNYFAMPNYPLYPARFQFGVSTNLWK